MTNTVHYTDDFEPDSVVIDHVYYDAKRNELYILLHSGSVCGYLSVPQDIYKNFTKASSAGSYWNSYIKWNYRGTSGDVNFVPAQKSESKPALATNAKQYAVVVNINGDLRFDLDGQGADAVIAKVKELVDKTLVDGTFYVKEVKINHEGS